MTDDIKKAVGAGTLAAIKNDNNNVTGDDMLVNALLDNEAYKIDTTTPESVSETLPDNAGTEGTQVGGDDDGGVEGTLPPSSPDERSRGLGSETDAAARFVEAYGPPDERKTNARDTVRYATGIGWLVWDSMRWNSDTEGLAVQELAKRCAKQWTRDCLEKIEAAKMDASSDGKKERAALNKALSYEGASILQGVLKLAKSDKRILIDAAKLDADPYKLNCENGLLDLRTGQIRPHDKTAMMTKLAPVAYMPEARHNAVDAVLATIRETCGQEVIDFLARAFGMSLTGNVSADVLFLLQGEGGAGKTTLLEALSELLGDYATELPFESFCLARNGRSPGGASPDLIKLRGSRLAIAEEGDRSATLDAGRLKALTGGGKLTARDLYSGFMTFSQTHHLWLCSNFEPRADADDSGVWRRMVKIQFKAIPPERRDPTIRENLLNDPCAKTALFAWAVRGAIDWSDRGGGRNGLGIPASIDALTADYRKRLDTVGQWLDEAVETGALVKGPFEKASNADLRALYEKWCEENGASPLGLNRFAEALRNMKGLSGEKTRSGRRWKGISITKY